MRPNGRLKIRSKLWIRIGSKAPHIRRKGAIKEGVGKMTGDKKTEAEGKAEKAAGKVQNTAGGVKDALKD